MMMAGGHRNEACEDPVMDGGQTDSWESLVASAAALAHGDRKILGITGPPGAGKSVLAENLAHRLAAQGMRVSLAGMDGFHLAGVELTRLARTDRKGAPDTFDVHGYVNLLRRLRGNELVYAPVFDRALEEPIGSAVPIGTDVSLVITEGNYLLLPSGGWEQVRNLLDECWYVDIDEQLRLDRLVARHMHYGRSEVQARERTYGSDQRNAEVVSSTRGRASRTVVVADVGS
jgi:pantothenate kinase